MGPTCGILPGLREHRLQNADGSISGCLLEARHVGPHLLQTDDARFFCWETDTDCECCTDEERACFVFWTPTDAEMLRMVQEAKR